MSHHHCQANMLFILLYLIYISRAARQTDLFPP